MVDDSWADGGRSAAPSAALALPHRADGGGASAEPAAAAGAAAAAGGAEAVTPSEASIAELQARAAALFARMGCDGGTVPSDRGKLIAQIAALERSTATLGCGAGAGRGSGAGRGLRGKR
eukprot:5459276-Pyramimonas_sp.AAC.1